MSTQIIARLGKLKKGATASDLATKLGAKESSVRNTLNILVKEGAVAISGTKKTAGPGRPSNVYVVKA